MKSCLSFAVREKEKKETVAFPAIPEELLTEILLRLPAKSLVRYKYVSKRWLSLITSPYFTNLYLKSSSRRRFFAYIVDYERKIIFEKIIKKEKHSDEYVLLTSSSSHDVMDQNLNLPRMGGGGYFVNTVRGLVCFRTGTRLQICNIHTRQVVELPIIRCEAIGYDNAVRYNNVWNYLGHDPVHDEYKVLSLVWEFTKEHKLRSEHHVLVLGTGASWKKTQCRIPHRLFQCYSRGISINGVLYFEAWTREETHVLISFDLSSEEFNFIELPNAPFSRNFHMAGLINYKGKVAVFDYSVVLRCGVMDFWVIEDADKSLWSDRKSFALPVYHQMDIGHLDGYKLNMGGTCCSGKIWLIKAPLTPNQPTVFIYDVGRNEITQRIEIKPSLLSSFKSVNWLLSTFWDDIENIMYLEI